MLNRNEDVVGADKYLQFERDNQEEYRKDMDDRFPHPDDEGYLDTQHKNFDKRLESTKADKALHGIDAVDGWLWDTNDEMSFQTGVHAGVKTIYKGNKAILDDLAHVQLLIEFANERLESKGETLADYYDEQLKFPAEVPNGDIPLDENDVVFNDTIDSRKVYPVVTGGVSAVVVVSSINGKPRIDIIFPDYEPILPDVYEDSLLHYIKKFIAL